MNARKAFRAQGVLAIAPQALTLDFSMHSAPEKPYTLDNGVATVAVRGALAYADSWFATYAGIVIAVRAAFADVGAQSVVLDIDSCGGEVRGLWTAAAQLRTLADAARKPYDAYISGDACSAAYALACSADKIYITPDGQAGSIGTLLGRIDATGADAQAGLRILYVSSSPGKLYGNPHVVPTVDELASYAALVDGDAQKFFALVSTRRGIPVATIQAMAATTYYGADAVGAGLADAVVQSIDEVALVSRAESNKDTTTMTFAELMTALQEVAAGDSSDAVAAKRMIAAFEPKEEDKPADDAPADPPADEEDDDEEEETDDKPKDKPAAKAAATSVSARTAGELATQVQAMQSQLDTLTLERDAQSRDAYLAQHSVGTKLRAVLETKSFAEVKTIVDALPKAKAAGALGTVKTIAQHVETTEGGLSAAEKAKLDREMGMSVQAKSTVTSVNGVQTFKHARKA
jgi:ClpP class serine protease